jgi:hypothetical protein
MRLDEKMRILGSVGVVLGYITMTHADLLTGVTIHFLSDVISVPYFIRTKSWDIVIMISILTTASISKLSIG